MRLLKKSILFIMVLSLLFCPLSASAESYSNIDVYTTEQEIEAIFTELNELAAEEYLQTYLSEHSGEVLSNSKSTAYRSSRRADLNNRLEQLGVNKIDPNDPADMASFASVVMGTSQNGAVVASSMPPSLSHLAGYYSIYQVNGTTKVNGTDYEFSYIRVTDDKGYNGTKLTKTKLFSLIGKETTQLADMLDYQFSFILSQFFGEIPYSWVPSWTMGTVFTALESMDPYATVTYEGNSSIYATSMVSVTQMMYSYVNIPNSGWVLCGVKASNISFARASSFVGNVGGKAYSLAVNSPTVTSSTGIATVNYVNNYVNGGGCDIDYIGSVYINKYGGGSSGFAPGFASSPGLLV